MSTHNNGISVYGSGLSVGFKGTGETNIINRSGEYLKGGATIIDMSGIIRTTSVTGAPRKADAGTTGFSGWIAHAVSTALSSVTTVTANCVGISGGLYTLGLGAYSGQATIVHTVTSGHTIQFQKYTVLSGAYFSSAGTSSQVTWHAIGLGGL